MGFVIALSDNSLFTFCHGTDMAYLLLYVDGIILCTSSNALRDHIIARLKIEFPISGLEPRNYNFYASQLLIRLPICFFLSVIML